MSLSTPNVQGYAIAERIGSGSYSTVYKAFKKDGTPDVVAIKCVEKIKLSGSAVDNIITEITLLKMLKHDYIVEMKDFLWDDRNIYIIMEYCDGGDLSCFIRNRRKLPETICRRFLQHLGLALKFLRCHNVSHMDLKPQNLLLVTTPKLLLKLGDFGFAQFLSSEDEKSSLRGSPLYMAPEILLNQKYDARVDLWSVGVIMYECLFGRAPYSSRSFDELAEKIKSQAPIQIPHGTSISYECTDLLTSLLRHDPNHRIGFETFFNHPFLDLEHVPSSESYEKAVGLVCDAVKSDGDKRYAEAFSLYCEALRYFVPLINAETDTGKKTALQTKVTSYLKRAEFLKQLIYTQDSQKKQTDQDPNTCNFEELCNLCRITPSLAVALDIGHAAEQYMTDGLFQTALEKFEASLGILVPALSKEPKGHRRDLLHMQIQVWLKAAETTKAFIVVNDLTTQSNVLETKEWCTTQ